MDAYAMFADSFFVAKAKRGDFAVFDVKSRPSGIVVYAVAKGEEALQSPYYVPIKEWRICNFKGEIDHQAPFVVVGDGAPAIGFDSIDTKLLSLASNGIDRVVPG